jgi:CRISPR-associated endonuclease/helicase Cas3
VGHNSIQIKLEPRSIAVCSPHDLPEQLQFLGNALQHQVDVFQQAEDHDIVLDLAPTGTGKTKAGLATLLHQPNFSAVYIAPTNALIEQQSKAAEQFIQDSQGQLNHFVKAVSAKEIRKWSNDRVGSRSGEKLYNLIRNPATVFPEVGASRPLLLVTNPDIFYYATFFRYNKLDQDNIAYSFLTQFRTIIFDEFHLYDAKQLVSLLFYLVYLYEFGFFKQGVKVILLTATPEPACEAALDLLTAQGVRIAKIDGEAGEKQIPSQTAVHLEIRVQPDRDELLNEIADEVAERFTQHPDQNGAVILDSKDHINRLVDHLQTRGLTQEHYGRITGSTPAQDRHLAAQKPIILATSTVDVGFNFEREVESTRQNLDWLIFSARDRAAFWQRIGRVGRVLGKSQTAIPSDAIAYLKDQAWEQGLATLEANGDRDALKQKLEELKSLERPFLQIYWQSEALLEVARPLVLLEKQMKGLPEESLILKLFDTLKTIIGGRREWKHYASRMEGLMLAEELQKAPLRSPDQKKWDFATVWQRRGSYKAKYSFLKAFLESKHIDDAEAFKAGQQEIKDWDKAISELDRSDIAEEMKEFAEEWLNSYAPIFQFRSGLFENVHIRDPHKLLLDNLEETDLDPIHLLRNYEFLQNGDVVEVASRAEYPYEIVFRLRYEGSADVFKATKLNRLTAFKGCVLQRSQSGATIPTPLLSALKKEWIPGVVVPTHTNQGVIFYLQKLGIESYKIYVECLDFSKEYTLFTGISAIMTAAMNNIKIRLMDEEDFWII